MAAGRAWESTVILGKLQRVSKGKGIHEPDNHDILKMRNNLRNLQLFTNDRKYTLLKI